MPPEAVGPDRQRLSLVWSASARRTGDVRWRVVPDVVVRSTPQIVRWQALLRCPTHTEPLLRVRETLLSENLQPAAAGRSRYPDRPMRSRDGSAVPEDVRHRRFQCGSRQACSELCCEPRATKREPVSY
jgi:hypothetical protein